MTDRKDVDSGKKQMVLEKMRFARLVKAVNSIACEKDAFLGDILEGWAGSATVCWCCSMLRGVLLGVSWGAGVATSLLLPDTFSTSTLLILFITAILAFGGLYLFRTSKSRK